MDKGNIDFEIIFNAIPSCCLVLDPSLTIVAVNECYLKLTRSNRSIINKKILDVYINEFGYLNISGIENLKASLERVLKLKYYDVMDNLESKISDSNLGGNVKSIWRSTNYPVLNNAGEVSYIIHNVIDISIYVLEKNRSIEYEVANIELTKSQVFLESILDNIPNMIFVKDAKKLNFIIFNKAGLELLGFSHEELIGKSDYDFFSKAEADHFTNNDRTVLSSRKILDIPEESIQTKFKGKRILHTIKVPIYDESGEGLYLVGISEDITDKLNLAEARLAQKTAEEIAQKKAQFLDIAAHELRTPITTLLLLIQLTQKQIKNGITPSNDIFDRLKISATRLSELVTDLLEMSSLEHGDLKLFYEVMDIETLISSCVTRCRLLYPNRNFIFNISNHQILLHIDKFKISQVIFKIIDNAVKYSLKGDIVIQIKETKNTIRVSVFDEGPCISEEQMAYAFSPFSRGQTDLTIMTSGLGLGLSISNAIIKMHGGVLGMERGKDQSCTVYFEIPNTQ